MLAGGVRLPAGWTANPGGKGTPTSCSHQTFQPQGAADWAGGEGAGLKGPHSLDSGCPLMMTGHLDDRPGVLALPSSTLDRCCPWCWSGGPGWLRVGSPPAWQDGAGGLN